VGTSLGLVAIATLVWSAQAEAGPFKKGPYMQNVSKTAVTIMWESSYDRVGTVTLGDGRTFESEKAEIHEVRVSGLEAGKRYRYTVECAGEIVEGEFATAPEADAPFMFVVFGDSRSRAASHQWVVNRVRREVPDFILGTGDMVNDGYQEVEWQQFFEIERDLLRENAMFPSVGNHDRQGRGRTADNYRKYFSLPENSPDPERYYAFTYGNARFLILDSNTYSFSLSDQTAWIEQQLQAARLDKSIKHIFVSMHHPPFSVSLHGGQTELRERWTPLYEKYDVDAVFSGHDHVYSRAERNDVKYFVSGGGGAPLYPRHRKPSKIDTKAVQYFERINHYLRVSVIGDFVEVTAIRADGTVIESTNWGELPEPPEPEVSAVGAPMIDAPADPAPEIHEAASTSASGRRGLGTMTLIGGMLVILAGAVLGWTWIRR
jgi:hypothetical protein